MSSFDWGQARKWGLNTFGFLCFMFLAVLGASSFVTWSWPAISTPKLAMAFRLILVVSAFMALVGGIED